MRSKSLSPGQLALRIGLAAFGLAAVLTLGAELAGEPIGRVVAYPGLLLANVIAWVRPELGRGGFSRELLRTCNIAVLSIVFFWILRRWTFWKRRS